MFDLAWSEIALIAVVAVVVIGPKDLPDAVRGVARGIQKLRRMAGEFQGHLDEVVREAKLEDVRDQIRDIRNFDLKSTIEKHVDEDGSITRTFRDDPFRVPPAPTSDLTPAEGTAAAFPTEAPPADATTPAPEVAAASLGADGADLATPALDGGGPPAAGRPVPEEAGPALPPAVLGPAGAAPAMPPLGEAPAPPAEAPARPAPHTA